MGQLLFYILIWCFHEKSPTDNSEICPECKEHIYLGMGGQKNMLNHIGKTQCCEIQQKKSKEAKCQPQAMLMASFFRKKEPVHPTVVPPPLFRIAPPNTPPYALGFTTG